MQLTRSDDLSKLLELLGADLDLADFEETGEKLDGHVGQHWVLTNCVLMCRDDCLPSWACHLPWPRSQRSRQSA